MAHKARVLKGQKTIRLHYANCKSYNADFDGDEMNVHFPQNELARAEGYNILSVTKQYLVPKDGSPLAGLIQDFLVAGVPLTMRGRFFDRAMYYQLVFAAFPQTTKHIHLMKPAILKPVTLWSGKQVISTVLLNLISSTATPLTLISNTKVSEKAWKCAGLSTLNTSHLVSNYKSLADDDVWLSETRVIIRHGLLLCGVLDKNQYGASRKGLVHSCFELYGGDVSTGLLTSLARVFNKFLQVRGFSLGYKDISLSVDSERERRDILMESQKCGDAVAAQVFGLPTDGSVGSVEIKAKLSHAHSNTTDNDMKQWDMMMKQQTDDISNKIHRGCVPRGLLVHFPHNNLQLMVHTGARGSDVNVMQMSCLLGQIELEGRRPALMLSGSSLPSFLPYDTSPRAGGFVAGRFLTGINPQEFFFHCMAGREGLIDTAVKTSRSGYLQRCIVKHLESVMVHYDSTARDSDGSVIQFLYGEDGLDITKSQLLSRQHFPFIIENKNSFYHSKKHISHLERFMNMESAYIQQRKVMKWRKKRLIHGIAINKSLRMPVLSYITDKHQGLVGLTGFQLREAKLKCIQMWNELNLDKQLKYSKKSLLLEPVLSTFLPTKYFGSVSEILQQEMDTYIADNPDNILEEDRMNSKKNRSSGLKHKLSIPKFEVMLYDKYLQSLCDPGESVGLLAAQSIGEPSTQMTLNTFHFAGRGEMNVTLGIPRLREILMVASSNIATPQMEIPIKPHMLNEDQSVCFRNKFNKCCLDNVLASVDITELLLLKNTGGKHRAYKIRMDFLSAETYSSLFDITPKQVLEFVEKKFVLSIIRIVKRKRRELASSKLVIMKKVRARAQMADDNAADNDQQNMQGDNDDDDDEDRVDKEDNDGRTKDKSGGDDAQYSGEEEESGILRRGEVEEEEAEACDDVEEVNNNEKEDDDDNVREETVGEINSSDDEDAEEKDTYADARDKKDLVTQQGEWITDYKYDRKHKMWCEIMLHLPISNSKLDLASLLKVEASKSVLYSVPGINRAVLTLDKDGGLILKTEGININEMAKYQVIVDMNKLYSNDIHAIAATYGIEAACKVIIKEMKSVFQAYGIQVDYRHLSLIGDYMTFSGKYQPFTRFGMKGCASPLQQITFETAMHFLQQATIFNVSDPIHSPSSRLVIGRPIMAGTGAFDCIPVLPS